LRGERKGKRGERKDEERRERIEKGFGEERE